MRNYVKEIHDAGLTYKELSNRTGISSKKLSRIARGIDKLSSKSSQYNVIRNENRRFAYEILRKSGIAPESANKYRRIGISSESYTHKRKRTVKHIKIQKTMFQIKILGLFRNMKTGEEKRAEGVSHAREKINTKSFIDFIYDNDIQETLEELAETIPQEYDDNQELIQEAINSARGHLGGTNWELIRIIDIEEIEYVIG